MSTEVVDFSAVPALWTRRHLLDLESLSAEELTCLLDTAAAFKDATDGCRRKLQVLAGRTLANLFFENSTRTRNSFSLAARRLGADTVEFSSSGSSTAKGETVIDTAKNIEAMNVDTVVIDGRILKHKGELVAIDTEEVIRKATDSFRDARKRAGGPS